MRLKVGLGEWGVSREALEVRDPRCLERRTVPSWELVRNSGSPAPWACWIGTGVAGKESASLLALQGIPTHAQCKNHWATQQTASDVRAVGSDHNGSTRRKAELETMPSAWLKLWSGGTVLTEPGGPRAQAPALEA